MKQLRDSKAQGSALFTLVSGIVIAIAVIYFLIKLAGSGSFADVNQSSEAATQTRIQPAGQFALGDGIPVGKRKGEQIFNKICIQCHAADSSVPNAPKIENNDDWAPRIGQGFDTLFQHALNGFNAMPAKGGAADLTDQELKRAITYMANKSGGNFPDPDAAAPADQAASGDAAASTPAAAGSALAADAPKADDKGAAAPAAGGADGQKVYEANCKMCHGGTIPGAPGVGKNDEWAPRIKQGSREIGRASCRERV